MTADTQEVCANRGLRANYSATRQLAVHQIHHEDKIFGDRLRNFLAVTAFLVSGYGLALHGYDSAQTLSTYFLLAVPILGILFSFAFLMVGFRTGQAYSYWFGFLYRCEEYLESVDSDDLKPYLRRREYYEMEINRYWFWKIFNGANAIDALLLPVVVGTFWLGLINLSLIFGKSSSLKLVAFGSMLSVNAAYFVICVVLYMKWRNKFPEAKNYLPTRPATAGQASSASNQSQDSKSKDQSTHTASAGS